MITRYYAIWWEVCHGSEFNPSIRMVLPIIWKTTLAREKALIVALLGAILAACFTCVASMLNDAFIPWVYGLSALEIVLSVIAGVVLNRGFVLRIWSMPSEFREPRINALLEGLKAAEITTS